MSVRFWELNLRPSINICPAVDRRARSSRPDVVSTCDDFTDTLIFLCYCQRKPIIHLSQRTSDICLDDKARPVTGIEYSKLWVVREQRPNTVIVHGQSMHASASRHTPYFDCLIRACCHNGIASLIDQDIPYII